MQRSWGRLMQRYSLLNIRVSPWSLSYRHECSKVIINHLGDGMAMDRVDACTPSLSTARCSTDATLYTNEAEKRLANRNRNERSMADSTLPEDMGNCVDTVVRRTSNFLRKVAAGRSVLPKDLLRKVSLTIANGPHLAVDLDERNSFKYLCMIHEQTRGVCFSASSLASRPVSVDSHNQKAWAKRNCQNRKAPGASKHLKVPPNYFIAIPVLNPMIRNNINLVQQTIVQRNALLQPALIDLPTLHLTLMVLHLADDSDIDRAKRALNDCRKELHNCSYSCPVLDVSGIGHFNHSVIYAKVAPNAELKSLNQIVGIMKVDQSSYADHVGRFMGREPVTHLQLCAMELPKDEQTGYYHVAHEVQLNSRDEHVPV